MKKKRVGLFYFIIYAQLLLLAGCNKNNNQIQENGTVQNRMLKMQVCLFLRE